MKASLCCAFAAASVAFTCASALAFSSYGYGSGVRSCDSSEMLLIFRLDAATAPPISNNKDAARPARTLVCISCLSPIRRYEAGEHSEDARCWQCTYLPLSPGRETLTLGSGREAGHDTASRT